MRPPHIPAPPLRVFSLFLGLLVLLCSFGVSASGQFRPIRVQTSETLVPVLVLDEQRAVKFRDMQPAAWAGQELAGDFKMWEGIAVANLAASDFQVYEDGKIQKIQSLTPERHYWWTWLRRGDEPHHDYWEAVGVGGGSWSTPDWSPLWKELYPGPMWTRGYRVPPLPWYMLAYLAPASQPGTCHQIAVKVDRPGSLVYSRDMYCTASLSAPDPLSDTTFADRLEGDLLSRKKKSKLPLSLAAVPVFSPSGQVLIRLFVHARLDPMTSIPCSKSIAGSMVVGLVYSQDGKLVQRFSDGIFHAPGQNSMYWDWNWFYPWGRLSCSWIFYEPTRYNTQLALPPGAYLLKFGLWNGDKFGRAEIPITVTPVDPSKLAIGGVALVRRYRAAGSNGEAIPASLAETYPPLVTQETEVTPTADSHFKKGGPFHFYLQLYEPIASSGPQPVVTLHLQIVNLKTGNIVKKLLPANAAPYATPGNPVIPIGGGIIISKLPKGTYQLQAQATDSTGAATPWRSADFTIK